MRYRTYIIITSEYYYIMYNKYLRCEIESITNVKAYIHILLAFFIRRSFANTVTRLIQQIATE